jgi:glycine/D-amino acid oxidase-like deaminating enzyme
MHSTTIAVIGAGFSGTLLTLHLLRQCPPCTRVLLIERGGQFGRGQAYSTGNPSHLLTGCGKSDELASVEGNLRPLIRSLSAEFADFRCIGGRK